MNFKRKLTVTAVALTLLVLSVGSAQSQGGGDGLARYANAKLRPGDRILLRFLREREMSDSLVVNERGETAFPKIGILRVSNMTVSELQDTLLTRYSEYYRLPEFQVAVLRRIVVNGEVRIPGVFLVDGSYTLRDVIARAGGITETGNRKRVLLIRDGTQIPVPQWDRESGEATDLRSGDQILVTRRSWFTMNALSLVSTAILVASFVISVSR